MKRNQGKLHPSQFPTHSNGPPLKIPPFTATEKGYRLGSDFAYETFVFGNDLDNEYCTLRPNGLLLIYSGYTWSGPKGAVNVPKGMMPSLVYACMRRLVKEGWLPPETLPPIKMGYRTMLGEWEIPLWRRIVHINGLCILHASKTKGMGKGAEAPR